MLFRTLQFSLCSLYPSPFLLCCCPSSVYQALPSCAPDEPRLRMAGGCLSVADAALFYLHPVLLPVLPQSRLPSWPLSCLILLPLLNCSFFIASSRLLVIASVLATCVLDPAINALNILLNTAELLTSLRHFATPAGKAYAMKNMARKAGRKD